VYQFHGFDFPKNGWIMYNILHVAIIFVKKEIFR